MTATRHRSSFARWSRAPLAFAFTGVLCAGLLCSGQAHAADVKITDKAKQHFKAGVSFLQDPDGARYEEAYQQFKIAYADSPSWKILGNLGFAAMKLERDGEAIAAFKQYLEEGGAQIEGDERAQYERDKSTLEAGVAWLVLSGLPVGANVVDTRQPASGSPIRNRYVVAGPQLRIGVRPGTHRLTVAVAGFKEAVWDVDASPATEQPHAFVLEKPTEPTVEPKKEPKSGNGPLLPEKARTVSERPVPVTVWIGLGVTAAAAVGTVAVGVLATGKKGDYDKANDGTQLGLAQQLKSDGEQLNLIADILLGTTAVAAGVTAAFYFTRPTVERPVATFRDRLRLMPAPTVGGGALVLSGRF